ncbi:hypothetical protein LPJ61_000443 [Coemansia biformis]|uniref:Uncharacterized protein n=1 Tax=Coemansia biformis TaxID=1286918 RepID=A0A9W8CY63_9FUNG|nr:hypothetical protein LPJ61_000443 [Coemansia biformis]
MPVARGLSVRFSRLPLEQRRSAAAVLMPAPDGSASDAAIDTAIGAGALNRQVGPEEHVDYPQASSAPAAQPQYVPGQSNRASVASGDEDQHSSQLFRVLGRTSSCRSREAGKAGDAMAPVLVTIARNGSVVGERTARPSDGLDRCPLLASSGPRDGPRGAAQAPPAAAYEGLRQGTHAMSPASAGISPSVGTSSFVTARMFPSTRFSEERATSTPMLDSVVEERGGLAAEARARELAFSRRQSDEVSDIAMRKHLHIGDEQAGPGHMHASPTGASQAAADQADLEWLRTQAAGQSNHEILAQRYTISQAIRQAASLRTAGPEHAGGVDDLLGRVSGLESQLTCMQAVMLSIEERLSGLSPTSHLSPSIVWPSRVGHAPGKSPVVGVVGERVQGRDLPEADAPVVGSASPPASTAAVQAATAALAELVGRSRLEFDAAASAALASIAGLAEPARSPGPQERDSSASSVDGARRSVD